MSAGVLRSFWQQQLVDEAVLAYVAWREESATVWAAYVQWSSATADEAIRAHAGIHGGARPRRDRRAHVYASVGERVSKLSETGV
jgi:hypothetical protein